jgi:ribosomal protein S18 acetylase RimI-like enzyme
VIRPVTHEDAAAVVDIAVDSGLFPAEASGVVDTMMRDYFTAKRDAGHVCVVDVADDGASGGRPRAVAYYEPAVAADGTWYLTMIAVRAAGQGAGRGGALMAHVEDDLRRRQQRLLLVETSGTPDFARTRAFYVRCAYEQEARVRDYYEPGDDMVLFRKDVLAGTAV